MGNVTSVTTQDGEADCTIHIALTIPVDDNEFWLPITPIYEAIQAHLREPCRLLSTEQAEQRAREWNLWPQEPLAYDAIYSVSELSYPLGAACESGEPLIIAEDPQLYKPRFGFERDEISIQVSRNHECGRGNDTWRAMACDGELLLSLQQQGCGWYEEQANSCGFTLTLAIAGYGDQPKHIATAIADRLRQAYIQ